MGIVAAVLIFIGLFLFGSMLYERLGDTARIAILFIVSFLLLGTGLFLERKRESWFTTSLIGCGFGAVYISLFITGLYYGRFEKEVLYFLILFWLIGIGLYVFHRQSNTVALLGQIGVAFSVILGSFGIESAGQFTFLCIYFAVLSLLYLWIVLWRFLPDTEKKPYSWIQLTAFGAHGDFDFVTVLPQITETCSENGVTWAAKIGPPAFFCACTASYSRCSSCCVTEPWLVSLLCRAHRKNAGLMTGPSRYTKQAPVPYGFLHFISSWYGECFPSPPTLCLKPM